MYKRRDAAVLGAILLLAGVVVSAISGVVANDAGSVWLNPWFDVGIALFVVGLVVLALWTRPY
ncbi:MAG: hypothetical protein JWN95_2718 [Frankiales bacterium]|nr:hypothetical protein [Frankiales bacterium]